ncbi:armadillo-type fold protein [Tanacetum coccineum]|uniref:Armadillo-type fold protein n=1 Tax=Tanacetum coccineum TaxID=301880 RepID=A0ABQ5GMM3_9ASTR
MSSRGLMVVAKGDGFLEGCDGAGGGVVCAKKMDVELIQQDNVELEHQLIEVGNKLSNPPPLTDDLLLLLDVTNHEISMLHALKPSMKALIHEDLLRHSDVDVNVAVASCMCEIVRITAPDAPYDDDQMRAVFQLIVSSFEGLADQSNRSYNKRLSVLENVCKTKAFVIMLDIECDVVIVRMFEHFLRSIRDYHRGDIFLYMETIMVLILKESEEVSVELLKPLLASVKKHSEGVLPVARELGEGVLWKSAEKLKPYLMQAVSALCGIR